MRSILTLIFSAFVSIISIAQFGYANNWHFGNGGEINFSSGVPVSSGISSMYSYEGVVSYSDVNGNLLFYSNGTASHSGNLGNWDSVWVWNQNHQRMPNGGLTGLTGNATPMQSSLVVPIPGSSSEYYLFCVDGSENYGPNYIGLTYSIVDMTLNGGLGDLSVKGVNVNVPVAPFLAEQITATKHANGVDYWLVLHGSNYINLDSDRFFVYLITATGISGPNIQDLGIAQSPGLLSTLQISPQGNKLIFNKELFDFDNSTGVISNPVVVNSGGYKEFSRSGRFLYVVKFDQNITQVDLESPGYPVTYLASFSNYKYGQLQMGPDGKIYVAMGFNAGFQPYLAVINDPEQPGIACNFVSEQVALNGGGTCRIGLPNFIDSDIHDFVGIEELSSSIFSAFPNPTNDIINVSLESEGTYELANGSGAVLLIGELTAGSHSVSIEELPTGVYFLRFENKNGAQVERIIKQ